MAKAELEIPFARINGRLDRNSETYYCTRFGKAVVSHYPRHKDVKKITATQKTRYSLFAQAVARAKSDLADPQKRAAWQSLFDKQQHIAGKHYRILRNFVIAAIMKEPDAHT